MSDIVPKSKLIGREIRFAIHLPRIDRYREDVHIVKEILHYDDGRKLPNILTIPNYEIPFYVTKEYYRDHKDKKESEDIEKLDRYTSTVSDLPSSVAARLGYKYVGASKRRDIQDSPYIYGIDVNSTVVLNRQYKDTWPTLTSNYKVAVLDIEGDARKKISTGTGITIISLTTKEEMLTVCTSKYVKGMSAEVVNKKIESIYDKHIPDSNIKRNCKRTLLVLENDVECIKEIFKRAHKLKPDFVAVWSLNFDLKAIINTLKKNGVDLRSVFCDPSLPDKHKYFRYIEGSLQKKTASGKMTNKAFEEQWHIAECTAHFQFVDAMSSYNKIRGAEANLAGGYGMDNVLSTVLGEKFTKLKLGDTNEGKYKNVDWHIYMAENHPLFYIVYNQWDVMSVLELDAVTTDLQSVLPMLKGCSDLKNFDSEPKRIVDDMHFFYIKSGQVLGVKPTKYKDSGLLGLRHWIVTLVASRVKEKGMRVIQQCINIITTIRRETFDSDQVSGYPSNGQAANISKRTTRKEIMDIAGIPKEKFKEQNMNLLYGPVSANEYCRTMFNFPFTEDLQKKITQRIKTQHT